MPLSDNIQKLQAEIIHLREELASKEKQLQNLQTKRCHYSGNNGFTTEEIVRYSRQMIMPNIQIDGQAKLKNGKVLIIGTGGLGCPAAIYLTSAGVGEITLVDYDEVELSNLHRQILHFESDINIPKVQSACNKLEKINSNIKIIPLKVHADSESLSRIIQDNRYNVVLDCSDNVATRYLVNDICVMNNIPLGNLYLDNENLSIEIDLTRISVLKKQIFEYSDYYIYLFKNCDNEMYELIFVEDKSQNYRIII